MTEEIKVFAPSSVSNIGCGFDILGFAIEGYGDEIYLRRRKDDKLVIRSIEGGEGITFDPKKNTATVAISAYLKVIGEKAGLDISIKKNVKPGSGLGSSASSSVGAVYAVNELLGKKMNKNDLIRFAMEGELAATGKRHADNVAPSMLGGFTVIRGYDPLDVFKITYPEALDVVIIFPDIEIKTSEARRILPKKVPLEKAVAQWGNVAGLITGLITSDFGLIGRSIKDEIVEPVRKSLIPEYEKVKTICMEEKALAFNISGSGPSMFALTTSRDISEKIMEQVRGRYSVPSTIFNTGINPNGVQVI